MAVVMPKDDNDFPVLTIILIWAVAMCCLEKMAKWWPDKVWPERVWLGAMIASLVTIGYCSGLFWLTFWIACAYLCFLFYAMLPKRNQ